MHNWRSCILYTGCHTYNYAFLMHAVLATARPPFLPPLTRLLPSCLTHSFFALGVIGQKQIQLRSVGWPVCRGGRLPTRDNASNKQGRACRFRWYSRHGFHDTPYPLLVTLRDSQPNVVTLVKSHLEAR